MEGAGKVIVFGILVVIALGALASGSDSRSGTAVADANDDTAPVAQVAAGRDDKQSTNARTNWSASRSTARRSEADSVAARPVGPPVVTTISPHDVTHRSARLRGALEPRSAVTGISFFILAERQRDIDTALARYDTIDDLSELAERITIEKLDSRVDEDAVYEERVYGLVADLNYVYQLCFQYVNAAEVETLQCGSAASFRTDDDRRNQSFLREPAVRTDRVLNVSDHNAVLTGRVDMNDLREGVVFFVYGESEEQVDEVDIIYDSYRDVDEDGENLQRVRVDSLLNSEREYELRVDDLDRSTEHFYQLCVEFDGRRDDMVCGGTRSFETVTFGNENEPDIFTSAATNVRSTSVTLGGRVDMNDFFDGLVFLVYGTDRERVHDVDTRYDEYLDVRQNGDELQRLQLDSDLDGEDSFREVVSGLQANTSYYYTLCVEYEIRDPRDADRKMQTIDCSEVATFTTF